MKKEIDVLYSQKKEQIRNRLEKFKNLEKEDRFKEMIFCILTPQSNAKKCWQAVEKISELKNWKIESLSDILKKHTRFHNNKASYLISAKDEWHILEKELESSEIFELRNKIAARVRGYGLKEASHFLRNIGKSDNKIAILDRHILRNLKSLRVIKDDKINGKRDYFDKEKKFIEYSKKIGIPVDELDLLFWSKENGEIFK